MTIIEMKYYIKQLLKRLAPIRVHHLIFIRILIHFNTFLDGPTLRSKTKHFQLGIVAHPSAMLHQAASSSSIDEYFDLKYITSEESKLNLIVF